MKDISKLLLPAFLFPFLFLCSCGPFGAGPWYAIYDGTKKDRDENLPPVSITYGPGIAALTNASAVIEWNTDLQSDSTVDYGLDVSYDSQETDTALDTVHSITLTGLSPNTAYHYRVASRSGTGAVGASADFEFTTKVSLTVVSAYGPASPDAGTWYYDSGEDIFAYAPETVPGAAKTQYRCTGHGGTGSVPAGGSDPSVSFTITEDSTLTWNWVTQYYLTTSTNPIGAGTISCSPLGNWHDEGSSPQLTAAGNVGYGFVNWTGDLTGSTNPDNLTVDAPKTVVANFTGETFTLTVTSAYGSPDPAAGMHFCASGANINASVDSPVSGGAGTRYECTGWSGTGDVDPTGTGNSTSFVIAQDSSVTWNWKTQYLLTTGINLVGAGTVSRNPDASWYDNGTSVELTAQATGGFTFSSWTVDLTGSTNPDSITMDSAKSVTANFSGSGTFYTLTVNSAHGSPDPPTSSVAEGTLVDASVDSTVYPATPGIRYTCTGWSGTGDVPSSGGTNSTSFTITQDSSITWTWKTQYQLTTSIDPVGGGSISRNPDATWYDENTDVELTANPSTSYVFDVWSGDLGGNTNPDTITMDGPNSVNAKFITTTYTLTVASAYGSPDPPTGDNTYTSGTNVAASVGSPVYPGGGIRYVCTGWAGTGSVPATGSTSSVSFNITEDSTITWNWKTQYELATTVLPAGAGTVQLTPPGGWYDPSTVVDVMAIIDPSYNFTGWSGDLSGTANPESLTVDSPKSVTANFELQATVVRVPADYGTIQAAIDACTVSGTVLVADGSYTGLGNRDLDFKGKAITVISENGPENCIIDCQNSGRGFNFHSGEGNDSIVNGFTIKNGNVDPSGGGINCKNSSSPTITNCIIKGCDAASYGGGIFCDHANPAISDCVILDNTAKYGGGIHVLYCTSVITDCIISGNTAQSYGGGIDCYIATGRPKLSKCIITDNSVTSSSSGYGGGGVASRYNAKPELADCLIAANTAGYYGGGIYCTGADCILTNCTVAANTAGRGGGAVYIDSTSALRNSVIWGNYATVTANEMLISSSTTTADYCDFRDGFGNVNGTVTATNCIHTDPLFASTAGGNFRLLPGSPCINTGDNTYVNAGDKDLDGRDRIIDTTVDIGAYELGGLAVPSAYATIQDAIDAAEKGDTVLVADGTYTGTGNKDLDFCGKLIIVSSENGPASCIIDCETVGRGFYFNSGETLGSVVAGLTIRNGDVGTGYGGGIYTDGSSPTITGCVLENSYARRGGAIACRTGTSPTIRNCIIDSNDGLYGGGIWCDIASSPSIGNCVITDNTADNNGGGIYSDKSSAIITNCLIAGNTAVSPGMGGGVYHINNSTAVIINSTIASNNAKYGGGIACNSSLPAANNTVIWGNSASVSGHQIYSQAAAEITLDYCDYANGAGDVVESTGGTVSPTICINLDPLFASTAGGNFRLLPGSPCINTGDNTYVNAGDKDLDGRDRIIDTTVDMGCYELGGLKVPSAYATIQDAIDAAETGDTVVVADGTYTGTGNRDLDFGGKLIVVCSENGAANCIIDCELSGRGFYFNSGESLGSVVAGFTVKNGQVAGNGGGIYCNSASPTITNCVITNNTASNNGGGFWIDNWSNPIVTNCVIEGNAATSSGGGGVYCYAVSNPTFVNCLMADNTAGLVGGGICCNNYSSPILSNCTLADNTATTNSGGGLYCYDHSSPTLSNTIFWGNTAGTTGYHIYTASADLTVTLNYCDYSNGGGDVTGSGTIIEQGVCIYTDPLFVTGPMGNYYLSQVAAGQGADSPCVDAGSGSAANFGLDSKTTRTDGVADAGTVDIGYHYEP